MANFWNIPHTWLPGDTATEEIFNREIRDNIQRFMTPPSFMVSDNNTYTTTQNSYVPVNSAFTIALVTSGKIIVGVRALLTSTAGATAMLAIGLDGANERPVARVFGATSVEVSAQVIFSGFSSGQHTPTLRWQTSAGGTATLRGTAASAPILFWAIER